MTIADRLRSNLLATFYPVLGPTGPSVDLVDELADLVEAVEILTASKNRKKYVTNFIMLVEKRIALATQMEGNHAGQI